MRLLVRPTPPPLWQGFIAAAALIGVETAVVVALKHFAPTMAFGTVYLLGVLLVGMAWGFGLAAMTPCQSGGGVGRTNSRMTRPPRRPGWPLSA